MSLVSRLGPALVSNFVCRNQEKLHVKNYIQRSFLPHVSRKSLHHWNHLELFGNFCTFVKKSYRLHIKLALCELSFLIWFDLVDYSWIPIYDFLKTTDLNIEKTIIMWKFIICRLKIQCLVGFSTPWITSTLGSLWTLDWYLKSSQTYNHCYKPEIYQKPYA